MKAIALISLSLVSSFTLAANGSYDSSLFSSHFISGFSSSKSLSFGFKNGDYRWSIGGGQNTSDTPNILSELTYRDIKLAQFNYDWNMKKVSGSYEGLVINLQSGFGFATDGTVQDSDYDYDDRQGEFSRSVSEAKGSKTFSLSGALGWQIDTSENSYWIPTVGYAYERQDFIKRHGEQIISTPLRTPSLGRFNGLDSTYTAHWFGPWVGIQYGRRINNHQLSFNYEYHWPNYYAEADWNLRTDFQHPKSFDHIANGNGVVTEFNYRYRFKETLFVGVQYQSELWDSSNGVDTVYYEDNTRGSTRLNETRWKTSRIAFSLDWIR